jgi:PKD repeat protein/pimeloyl-ACP methyl ester carboxylesterase
MRSIVWIGSAKRLFLALLVIVVVSVSMATAMAQAPVSPYISPYLVETENQRPVVADWVSMWAPENRSTSAPPPSPVTDLVTPGARVTETVPLSETVSLSETVILTDSLPAIATSAVTMTAALSETLDGMDATTPPADAATVATSTAVLTTTVSSSPVAIGREILVPFLRFRTSAQNPLPPLFMLIGEDQSALAPLTQVEEALPLIALMVNASDVILVGHRGMASGQPNLECAGDIGLPLERPAELEQVSAALGQYYVRCADFWREAGTDLSGYNVREIAGDVNQLREELGYDQIRLAGVDLGVQIGLEYLRDYGDSVDRALFAHIIGPDQVMKLPADLQAALERVDQLVRADAQLSGQIPDFLALVSGVLNSLEGRTVTSDVVDPQSGELISVTAGKLDLQYATAMALGGTEQFALPVHYFNMSNGDFSWLAEQALAWRRSVGNALVPVLSRCASGASEQRRTLVAAQSAETLLGNAANGVDYELCEAVDTGLDATLDIGDEVRQPVVSDVPTLLISGGMDGHTPASNGEAVVANLVNGQHVVVACGTHDLLNESISDLAPLVREFMRGDPLVPLSSTNVNLACAMEPLTSVPVTDIVWTGEYFNNRAVQNDPTLVRQDPAIDFDWGDGSPSPDINPDNFSARWSATPQLSAGTYRFSIWVDDGARLWVDDVPVLDAWTLGPARNYIVDVNVVRGLHNIRMDYFEAEANALARLTIGRIDDYPDWRTEYFESTNLIGAPVVSRNEEAISHVWGDTPPVPGLAGGGYSVRWEQRQFLPAGGYRYDVDVSGGVRLWVDGVLLIDDWSEVSARSLSADSLFESDGSHDIRVEYVYVRGNASIQFAMQPIASAALPTALIQGESRVQVNAAATFDGSGSTAADGSPLVAYAWDLGDGTTATGPTTTHAYLAAGTYNVTLTVTDAQGQIGKSTLQVLVADEASALPATPSSPSPPVVVIRSPDQGVVGQVVNFDARASVADNPVTRFDWQFGDGTGANAIIVDKVFGAPGVYTVRLTLTDDQGLQGSTRKYIQVFAPTPVVGGQATPTPVAPDSELVQPTAPLPTPQEAVPTAIPVPESADANQPQSPLPTPLPGAPAAGQVASPSPTADPNYYVPPTPIIVAIVDNNPLNAVPNEGGLPSVRAPLGKRITFDATRSTGGSEPIRSYFWDFGDGESTSTETQVGLEYLEPGTYEVVLVIQDEGGQTVDSILVVTVEGP